MSTPAVQVKTKLDWSAYESDSSFGFDGFDDYSGSDFGNVRGNPSDGGYAKAAAMCMGKRQCQNNGAGVMCPSYRVTDDETHSTNHRAAIARLPMRSSTFCNAPILRRWQGLERS